MTKRIESNLQKLSSLQGFMFIKEGMYKVANSRLVNPLEYGLSRK